MWPTGATFTQTTVEEQTTTIASAIDEALADRPGRDIPSSRSGANPGGTADAPRGRAIVLSAVAREAISDVIWRWGRVGEATEHGLWGGTATALFKKRGGDYVLRLTKLGWTKDTNIAGDIDIHFHPGVDSMEAAVDVTTPTGRTDLEIRSAHVVGPSTVETITGTLSGRPVEVTVGARFAP